MSLSSLAPRSTFVILGVHAVLIMLQRNHTSLASLLLLISLRGTKIIRTLSINPDVASHEVKFDREEWRYKKVVTINFRASYYELVPTSYNAFSNTPKLLPMRLNSVEENEVKKRRYHKFLSESLRFGANESYYLYKNTNVASYEVIFSREKLSKEKRYYKFLSALPRDGADEIKCNRNQE